MTSRAPRFKQADLTRALRAALAAGMKPSGYRIDASGDIIVMLGGEGVSPVNSFDALIGERR